MEALRANYDDHQWNDLKTHNSKSKLQSLRSNDESLILLLIRSFHIRSKQDWYRISYSQISSLHHFDFLSAFGKLTSLLNRFYPDQDFVDAQKPIITNKKSAQRWVAICLAELFPRYLIIEDYSAVNLRFPSDVLITFDIFIPSLFLAVEYHGEQHYNDEGLAKFASHLVYQSRDSLKLQLSELSGLTYIPIPYWWNRSVSSLSSSLRSHLFNHQNNYLLPSP